MAEELGLKRLLDLNRLSELFMQFHTVTGMDVTLHDPKGAVVLRRGSLDVCGEDLTESCRSAIVYGGVKSHELNAPYIFEAPCGLVKCALPVVLDGKLLGSIVCGPVILWDADEFARDEFVSKLTALGIETDGKEIDVVPRKECDYMTGAATMLKVLVDYICTEESKYLAQKVEMARLSDERNAVLEQMTIDRTRSEYHVYPTDLEKELITYVRLGDKSRAGGIINSFLNEIFFFADGDIDIIKAKLYELMAFLSRAAVEAGAPVGTLKYVVKKSSALLLENVSYQDLCTTTVELLNEFIDVVYSSKPTKSSEHIAKAIEYISAHYGEEITLEMLAKEVFVSSYYLSHLFRDELNMTFSDYLTKVRIERAKELLQTGEMTVEAVAERTGFKDTNYFSKIFKKIVGVTPAKYRR